MNTLKSYNFCIKQFFIGRIISYFGCASYMTHPVYKKVGTWKVAYLSEPRFSRDTLEIFPTTSNK